MKSFNEFIGESREGHTRPALDEVLRTSDTPSMITRYFDEKLGADFLEFDSESPMGIKITKEFSPKGGGTVYRYKAYMTSISRYPFYYYVSKTGPSDLPSHKMLAIRSTDWNTWWISQDSLAMIDPTWAIGELFGDL